ncbi:MAG: MBL fold metallo-hydrolase [Rhodospirillales bacterium]|nr:MBL fold metallo-hydrolase [Rhodospirillales bacterium]
MPLPYQLNHINLWLAEDDDGWTLVDCGIKIDDVMAIWDELFAGPLSAKPLKRIICTHCHPDHMGLAGWLLARTGAEFVTTRAEWAMGRLFSMQDAFDADLYRRHFNECGCGDEISKMGADRFAGTHKIYSTVPTRFTSVRAGATLAMGGHDWRVIIGLGHAFEQACLYSATLNILIAGDQILPRITPAILIHGNNPNGNPLDDFLESNRGFRDLPGDVTVLPSHNLPFTGMHRRLDEYDAHHAERLEETLRICAEPTHAFEVSTKLFKRDLSDHHLFFALGETLAHLRYLEAQGRMVKSDSGGVVLHTAN